MNLLLQLFLTFLKIGCFTFGGGIAMIAVVEEDCVERKHWITHEEMMDLTVIAESTPGPIAINCATFVGYKMAGIAGAAAATAAMVIPSFCIIYVISLFLDRFLAITLIAKAFHGIRLAVGILILSAAFKMLKKMPKSLLPLITMILAAGLTLGSSLFGWKLSTITLLLMTAAFHLLLYYGSRKCRSNGGTSV